MPQDLSYELTAHAAVVIAERQISRQWIEQALRQPEKIEHDTKDPVLRHALRRIPEHGDRVLRVVYNETSEPWSIVTAYFDRSQRDKL